MYSLIIYSIGCGVIVLIVMIFGIHAVFVNIHRYCLKELMLIFFAVALLHLIQRNIFITSTLLPFSFFRNIFSSQ